MKVNEEAKDKYGKSVLIFPKSASLAQIHDWLNLHYNGYTFAIILNECGEYEPMDEILVDFLADIADEAIEASGDYVAVRFSEWQKIQERLRRANA